MNPETFSSWQIWAVLSAFPVASVQGALRVLDPAAQEVCVLRI